MEDVHIVVGICDLENVFNYEDDVAILYQKKIEIINYFLDIIKHYFNKVLKENEDNFVVEVDKVDLKGMNKIVDRINVIVDSNKPDSFCITRDIEVDHDLFVS